jgi:GNAT superfamily N-acetyltransferase
LAANAQIELRRLDADVARPQFSCGDSDIDEFFHKDSIEGCNELLCVTYALIEDSKAIAFFSVSNDAIKKEDVPKSAFKRAVKVIPFTKRYSSMPAAKIGRLGVAQDRQNTGCGTTVLDFLKVWFTSGNKTGCRFLIVDAYNNERAKNFYLKNKFSFLTSKDSDEDTRIMYFDLIRFST